MYLFTNSQSKHDINSCNKMYSIVKLQTIVKKVQTIVENFSEEIFKSFLTENYLQNIYTIIPVEQWNVVQLLHYSVCGRKLILRT